MRVVVISKVPFNTITFTNVVSITVSGSNYVINDGTNHTYSIENNRLMIL